MTHLVSTFQAELEILTGKGKNLLRSLHLWRCLHFMWDVF